MYIIFIKAATSGNGWVKEREEFTIILLYVTHGMTSTLFPLGTNTHIEQLTNCSRPGCFPSPTVRVGCYGTHCRVSTVAQLLTKSQPPRPLLRDRCVMPERGCPRGTREGHPIVQARP